MPDLSVSVQLDKPGTVDVGMVLDSIDIVVEHHGG